jgi:hypothetical protein
LRYNPHFIVLQDFVTSIQPENSGGCTDLPPAGFVTNLYPLAPLAEDGANMFKGSVFVIIKGRKCDALAGNDESYPKGNQQIRR